MKKEWVLTTAALGILAVLSAPAAKAQEVSTSESTPTVEGFESGNTPASASSLQSVNQTTAAPATSADVASNNAAASSKFKIFAGFSYLNDGLLFTRVSAYGWNLQGTWNLSHHVGFTADFSGHNGSTPNVVLIILPIPKVDQDAYFFLLGPTFTGRLEKFEVFGHFLVGAAHGDLGAAVPGLGTIQLPNAQRDTNFALGLGGGLDYMFAKHWGWRMLQGDYLFSQLSSSPIHSVRISTGVLWRR